MLQILIDVVNFSTFHIFQIWTIQICQHCQLYALRENSNQDTNWLNGSCSNRNYTVNSLTFRYELVCARIDMTNNGKNVSKLIVLSYILSNYLFVFTSLVKSIPTKFHVDCQKFPIESFISDMSCSLFSEIPAYIVVMMADLSLLQMSPKIIKG